MRQGPGTLKIVEGINNNINIQNIFCSYGKAIYSCYALYAPYLIINTHDNSWLIWIESKLLDFGFDFILLTKRTVFWDVLDVKLKLHLFGLTRK